MVLKGRIVSGLGTAQMWVSKIEKAFKEKTKMTIFHGTLNIDIEKKYIIKPDFIIEPQQYGGTQKVLVKKCSINGNSSYIVRAEKNQTDKGDHDLNIIEVVSDINFRETYNLKNSDELQIKVN